MANLFSPNESLDLVYIDNYRFFPKLTSRSKMRKVIEYFLSKSLLINLLTGLIILVGGFKAFTMNREAFPNINFDIVTGSRTQYQQPRWKNTSEQFQPHNWRGSAGE